MIVAKESAVSVMEYRLISFAVIPGSSSLTITPKLMLSWLRSNVDTFPSLHDPIGTTGQVPNQSVESPAKAISATEMVRDATIARQTRERG